jgi:hypothetical protein
MERQIQYVNMIPSADPEQNLHETADVANAFECIILLYCDSERRLARSNYIVSQQELRRLD